MDDHALRVNKRLRLTKLLANAFPGASIRALRPKTKHGASISMRIYAQNKEISQTQIEILLGLNPASLIMEPLVNRLCIRLLGISCQETPQ